MKTIKYHLGGIKFLFNVLIVKYQIWFHNFWRNPYRGNFL